MQKGSIGQVRRSSHRFSSSQREILSASPACREGLARTDLRTKIKRDQVQDTIHMGTILVRAGTLFPEALHIEDEPCMPGWRLVRDLNGYALHRKVHKAGWTFFFLAGEVRAIAFGADEQSTARRAIKRILAKSKSKEFNSLEITRVASKGFLGLPYVSVQAQSRHIQEGLVPLSAKCTQKSGDTGTTVARAKPLEFISTKGIIPEQTNRQVGVAATPESVISAEGSSSLL
jgi:hypothetical protein